MYAALLLFMCVILDWHSRKLANYLCLSKLDVLGRIHPAVGDEVQLCEAVEVDRDHDRLRVEGLLVREVEVGMVFTIDHLMDHPEGKL